MSSNIESRIKDLDNLKGYGDLTPGQLKKYKELQLQVLRAIQARDEYLDSLVKPLTFEQREAIYENHRDEFLSNNTGDGMDEDRVDEEVAQMSDWEFRLNFD